ncbi:acyl-CoA dehydrogenase [Burkholderia pseudomultivorans]|uniref:3-methylmercaptopropionyl-CoA dehydrogenase n=1 Tax=Burkholderia pseudomultivorans TaxID=1207504 RepID=A0ABU2DW15_9BURK|nr:acyl-CoA dehydrogenase [Burkholderia pseudomultivorans]MDR8727614.1 3-methylmercaptopropionyl-CoA dehydrogenase [Burkholderia pseudomultivorans]MDR8734594.1 3-methylmercaptopropionyl-CoA dehydrogenase [Burkholderia pseudomultivorans]MDR8740560.1 3-methylmercaptopropionyl-CoA dehydrogenase [Burkholderia pseudomultivorans]MDR8751775.1 3-methylmercaptopropionyl-CoA dehydrogenase [Burkholderia pseudomultivorans]MDR8776974.1 3-methylmercaptopropionyl-CoA dehydrogenase [Burkholderia pseudomultivo
MSLLMSRRDLAFLLYDWLDAQSLVALPRYAEHSRETFDAVLDTSERIAADLFAPHAARGDREEPQFDGERVTLIPEVEPAVRAFADAGLIAAGHDEALGGMRLPKLIEAASFLFFQAANIATAAYPFLTVANANLLVAHGSPAQVDAFARPELEGRFLGTMCLSEPQAGSSLSDIATRADFDGESPLGPRYRLTGNKMWISGGEHELAENIVHLVLAKIPDEHGRLLPGTRGISLFIVPKYLPGADAGTRDEHNDVVLAGLNHKMGYRGTTNCLLNFGEGTRHRPGGRAGAIGYRVGEPNHGLAYMFHMMNEARIGVGAGAVALGYTGYLHALDYARNRPQGRPLGPAGKDAAAPQAPIVAHPDVRRMLLAQKAYVEGGLALVLYCARLVDEARAHEDAHARADATRLLDILTPIAKSWPSQWCLAANDLAIQVHGGYGYTRDYAVERLYRDNRLNPIHEGTHGIQALDLLGRKVGQDEGAALHALDARVASTVERARRAHGDAAAQADALARRWTRLLDVTRQLGAIGDPQLRLANASVYLEAFGHVVVAWLWLDVALAAQGESDDFHEGKRAAARYFFRWELPKVDAQLDLLASVDTTTLDMRDAWF